MVPLAELSWRFHGDGAASAKKGGFAMRHVSIRHRRRVFGASLLLVALTVGASATALASTTTRHSKVRTQTLALTIGVAGHRAHVLPPPPRHGATPFNMTAGPLTYADGPVMVSGVHNYVVLWDPGTLQNGAATGYSAKYASLAMQWFKDQPQSPLYANANQYYQVVGTKKSYIIANTAAPKLLTDTNPFPTGQCTHPTTGTNCITDANLTAELTAFLTAHALKGGLNNEYFVLTPYGEGSCFEAACAHPSYTYYCAYHSDTVLATKPLIYANMPYPTDPSGPSCFGGAGQTFPSGDVNADALVNVMSHEQYESVTDPEPLSGWADAALNEIGDVCAWQFGPTFASGGDLQINGHPYSTQSEGDNHNLVDEGGTGCVYAGP
jgi:hypothetical protein